MSNTSKVSPIDADNSAATEAAVAALAAAAAGIAVGTAVAARGIATGAAAVWRFLNEESAAEAAAVAQRRQERDSLRVRGGGARLANCASLPLTVRDSSAIRSAAERRGFRPAAAPMVRAGDVAYTLLQRGTERLAIAQTRSGTVLQTNSGSLDIAREVVRQHSIDRVADYLAGRNMKTSVAKLANGEIEIRAQEPRGDGGEADRAVVTARVRSDGVVDVDVDRCVGRRCEEVVGGIAEAVGGKVQEVKHKDAWYAETATGTSERQRTGY
jgi:hypothetical protein